MRDITTIEELEQIYDTAPSLASTAKEINYINAAYRRLIENSPFVALATIGLGALDCSPRGDSSAVVRVVKLMRNLTIQTGPYVLQKQCSG